MKKKPVALLLSGVLLLGCTVGGTLAWLTAKSDTVNNTFTVGNIEIGLNETWNTDTDDNGISDVWTGKMTPGVTLAKDPTVTVMAGSEDCYVFVKITESADFDKYMTYEIADGWQQLKDANGNNIANVYYQEVTGLTAENANPWVKTVLKGDGSTGETATDKTNGQIAVKDTITKTMMQSIADGNEPTLTFTAYAVQMYPTNDKEWTTPYEAWTAITGQLEEQV